MGTRAVAGLAATAGAGAAALTRPRQPQTRDQLIRQGAAAAGVGVAIATVAILYYTSGQARRDRKRKEGAGPYKKPVGHPLCPLEAAAEPADLTGLHVGDFVIVTLANQPNTLRESTWAKVTGVSKSRIVVEIVGEARPGIEEGLEPIPGSLKTEWHGFHIGQKLFLSPECIWDVLHQNPQPGAILCGPQGQYAFGEPPLAHVFLATGFRVHIALAPPGGRFSEPVWAEVLRISPTGSVVTARILSEPQLEAHGFREGDVVEFARDCIFGVEAV